MATTPTNSSTEDITGDPLGRGDVQVGFEVFLSILICLTSFSGNSLVVYAIHKDARLNTVTNLLIENLAYSDILMAILHMPFWIVSLRYGKWVFSNAICEVAGVTQLIFGIVSLLTMTAIAINRYLKICKRHLYTKYFSNRKTTYIIITFCWISSIAVNTPQLYGWGNIVTTFFSQIAPANGDILTSLTFSFLSSQRFSFPPPSYSAATSWSTERYEQAPAEYRVILTYPIPVKPWTIRKPKF